MVQPIVELGHSGKVAIGSPGVILTRVSTTRDIDWTFWLKFHLKDKHEMTHISKL